MTRVEACKKRLNEATPGKWVANDIHEIFGEGRALAQAYGPHDGALIAHAPQDLRDLLDLYEAAKKSVREIRGAQEHARFIEDYKEAMEFAANQLEAVLSRLDQEVES